MKPYNNFYYRDSQHFFYLERFITYFLFIEIHGKFMTQEKKLLNQKMDFLLVKNECEFLP